MTQINLSAASAILEASAIWDEVANAVSAYNTSINTALEVTDDSVFGVAMETIGGWEYEILGHTKDIVAGAAGSAALSSEDVASLDDFLNEFKIRGV